MGGWTLGNPLDGCRAEYVRVPDDMANRAPVPGGPSDEQVLMYPDTMSTGFSGAETAGVRICDAVTGRVDLAAMVTHRIKLADIEAAYDLFAQQREGVPKVAITP